jgi:poly-gamma-glutamate capsule biosynthesis protein CapA/YwtB (metallophosphatase superfamily)
VKNWEEACQPALKTINGLRVGLIQRTSVYWPSNHEASALHPGVATVKIHTAYSPKIDGYASNRPGTPPDIHTWADKKYLKDLVTQIHNLRKITDILIISFHWGYKEEILDYMREIAHAAIDAGADIIFGHGPHMPLPMEIYKSKPIFYGVGSFVFHNGHRGKVHGNWVGMIGRVNIQDKKLKSFGFSLVRRDEKNQTFITDLEDETSVLEPIFEAMRANGLSFNIDNHTVYFKTDKIES